ncbi:hypothetical protein ACE8EZ_05090 [Pantoea deleyi]|uniref:hypothetical protein n=1 Tax=Pantoea deleyi TaxID=470932 RepID=UPI0035D4E299
MCDATDRLLGARVIHHFPDIDAILQVKPELNAAVMMSRLRAKADERGVKRFRTGCYTETVLRPFPLKLSMFLNVAT